MRNSTRRMFLLLTIVVSLVAVQSLCAVETHTVTGTIDTISTKPNKIVIDGTIDGIVDMIEVSGISFSRLANLEIVLAVGTEVSVDVYEFECSDGTIKFMAYSITVGIDTVDLREVPSDA